MKRVVLKRGTKRLRSKTKLKRRSKVTYRKLMRMAIQSFNHFVREYYKRHYGNCPFCGVRPIEQCFHFISAYFLNTRFDWRNVIGSCAGCNRDNEWHPHTYLTWFLDHRGRDTWDELMAASKKQIKLSREDLQRITREYDGMYDDLERMR